MSEQCLFLCADLLAVSFTLVVEVDPPGFILAVYTHIYISKGEGGTGPIPAPQHVYATFAL